MVYDSAACLGELPCYFCSTFKRRITSPSPKRILICTWKGFVSKSLFYLSFFNKSNSLSCGSSSNRINGIGSNSTLSLSGLAYRSVGLYPPGRIQRISQEWKYLSPSSGITAYSILYSLPASETRSDWWTGCFLSSAHVFTKRIKPEEERW